MFVSHFVKAIIPGMYTVSFLWKDNRRQAISILQFEEERFAKGDGFLPSHLFQMYIYSLYIYLEKRLFRMILLLLVGICLCK